MGEEFSDVEAVGEVDLFGNPFPQQRGRGRPAHVPTAETRAFVNMLFVCGHDVMTVAKAIGLKKTAFYEHYRCEIIDRAHAAVKFKGHQMLRLNRQAANGNVAAEKALAGMIAGEQIKALGERVKTRARSSAEAAAPAKAEPQGVKAQRRALARKIAERSNLYGQRPAPGQMN